MSEKVSRCYRVRVYSRNGSVKLVASIISGADSIGPAGCVHKVTAESAGVARLLALAEHSTGACKPGQRSRA